MESTHFKWIDVSLGQESAWDKNESSEIKNSRKRYLRSIPFNSVTNDTNWGPGEQCHPCTIQKYHTSNGNVTKSETTVYGRKIPLREKLIQKHVHLHTDREMSVIELTKELRYRTIRALRVLEKSWNNLNVLVQLPYGMIHSRARIRSCNSQNTIRHDTAVFKPDTLSSQKYSGICWGARGSNVFIKCGYI